MVNYYEDGRLRADQEAKRQAEALERSRQESYRQATSLQEAKDSRARCSVCQASNSASIGGMCWVCWNQQNPEQVEFARYPEWKPEDDQVLSDYHNSFEDNAACRKNTEQDEVQLSKSVCTSCFASNSVVCGSLCYSCWKVQYPDDKLPEPTADAPQYVWDAYLSELPIQVHHLASDKAGKGEWTSMAIEIAALYELELSEAWNLLKIHHKHNHPPEYHAYVVGTMLYIMNEARGDTSEFKRLYKELVSDLVMEFPQMVRWRGWDR